MTVPTAAPHRPTPPAARSWPGRAGALVRIAVGLLFVSAGLPKLGGGPLVADFHRWHIPLASLAVPTVGAFEVLAGAALATGVLTRIVGGLLAVEMTIALLTAGIIDGGQHRVLPPILAAVCAAVAVRGGAAWQLGTRLARRPRQDHR